MSQQCVALHVDCCYRLVALPKLNLSLEQGLERSGRSGSWANAGVRVSELLATADSGLQRVYEGY